MNDRDGGFFVPSNITERMVGEVLAVTPSLAKPVVADHVPAVSIEVVTTGRRLVIAIDERSARFLAAVIPSYLKPFQSPAITGTPSLDASKPSA